MTFFFISRTWLLLALIGLAIFDERQRRIPNRVLFVTTMLFLFAHPAFVLGVEGANLGVWWGDFFTRLLAAVLVLLFTGFISFFRPQSLGMGDCKLMAVIMLYGGWPEAAVILWLAFFFTAVRGIFVRVMTRSREHMTLAFAPQVAIAVALELMLHLWIVLQG